jgi:hypothetical protein
MRFAFYCGVLLVAAASVVFGLDWMSAPMPAMPDVKNVVFVPPPPPPPPRVAQPVVTPPPPPASTPPVTPPPSRAAAPAPQTPTAEAPPAPPVATAPRQKCDVDACARAYRSFQESDCTYNPSFGPRRLCTKGDPEKYAREHAAPAAAPTAPTAEQPSSLAAPEPGTSAAPDTGAATEPAAAPAAPRCNVAACAAAYPRSFRESDCTFNPSSGPRKVCEK